MQTLLANQAASQVTSNSPATDQIANQRKTDQRTVKTNRGIIAEVQQQDTVTDIKHEK